MCLLVIIKYNIVHQLRRMTKPANLVYTFIDLTNGENLHYDFMQLISNLDHPHQNNHSLHKSPEPIQRCVVVVEGFISHSRANGKRQGNCESQPLDEVKIGKETTC